MGMKFLRKPEDPPFQYGLFTIQGRVGRESQDPSSNQTCFNEFEYIPILLIERAVPIGTFVDQPFEYGDIHRFFLAFQEMKHEDFLTAQTAESLFQATIGKKKIFEKARRAHIGKRKSTALAYGFYIGGGQFRFAHSVHDFCCFH